MLSASLLYGALREGLVNSSTALCFVGLSLLLAALVAVPALRRPHAYCAHRTPLLMATRFLRMVASAVVATKVRGGAGGGRARAKRNG